MPEAARQDDHKVVEQAHEKFSETVRLAMLSLLGLAFFCLLITLGTPDSALLVADPTIKMPFADVQVSFHSFLILAPFLLIVVTLYLHIFYGYWLDLEQNYQHLTRSRESNEPSIERLPMLFSLDHPVPRLLTTFIFYWLVPLVLLTITWKAMARAQWGVPLVFLTGLVTITLVFLQIRRCPASQRQLNRSRWGVMVLIAGCIAAVTFKSSADLLDVNDEPWRWGARSKLVVVPQWLPRPLNIFRADLKDKWLARVNLRDADARFANFQGAALWGAALRDAALQGVDLREVQNLMQKQLQSANIDEHTRLPPNLQRPLPAGAASPPSGPTEASEEFTE